MKKILAIAIVLVMLAAMVACEASKGDLTSINDYVAPNYTFVTETGTFIFAEAGGNTAVITGYIGMAEPHAVVVPSQVTVAALDENAKEEDNVREVVGIDNNAFYYCTAMTSVTIPDSIETIGDWAFAGCTGLSEIVLPDSVVSIGKGAFHGCDTLTKITLSQKLTKIDSFAFYGCNGLKEIALPDTLVEIGSAAFFGCQGLTTLDIPAATTIIGDMAFYQCNHLTEIKINTTAETIEFGEYIFWSELKDVITAPEGSKAAEYVDEIVVSGVGEEVTTEGETTEGETTEGEETTADPEQATDPEEQTTEPEEQTTEAAE